MYYAGGKTDIINESVHRWASDRNRDTEFIELLSKEADKQIGILHLDILDMEEVINDMEKQIQDYEILKERFKTELKERRRIVVGLSEAAKYKPQDGEWDSDVRELDYESIKAALISWAEIKEGVGRAI
jgi:hypothetical protein